MYIAFSNPLVIYFHGNLPGCVCKARRHVYEAHKRCPKVLVRRGGMAGCQIRQPVGKEGMHWGPRLGLPEPCKEEEGDSGLWSQSSFILYHQD